MTVAILDARQWQQTVDLRSGRKIEAEGPVVDLVRGLLSRHPFPGDCDPGSNPWVVDTALDLVEKYKPSFAFLSLAQQYYSSRFNPMTAEERQGMVDAAIAEAQRFGRESGFLPIIVGTGGMTKAIGPIDLSTLDGLGMASNWSARYAGLYGLSDRDREWLRHHPNLERLATRQEILDLFGGGPEDGERLPEELAVAKPGYHFKNTSLRRLIMLPDRNMRIPVSAAIGPIESLTDIKGRVLTLLETQKVALIILEGVGADEFTPEHVTCRNGEGWYCYEPTDAQYLALTSGKHCIFSHNGGYRYFLDDNEKKHYPFSGYFTEIPTGTIGFDYPGKSISVGNRSMFMHVTTGCDICCECFARNLYNQGCMAVMFNQDK